VRLRVLSRSAIERVLEETRPYLPEPGEAVESSRQVGKLFSAVSVESREADTFAIEYIHGDPVKAALVPTLLATLLVEESRKDHSGPAAARPELLAARLARAREDLQERETSVRRLLERRVGAVPSGSDGRLESRAKLETEKRVVAADLAAARTRADRQRQVIAERSRPSLSPAGGSSAELETLRTELGELRKRYTEEHPDVKAVTATRTYTATFTYRGAPGVRVSLVGDFNGWDPTALPLSKRGKTFAKRVNLPPGEHQYKFLVDGEWHTDPAAEVQVPNGVGSLNSVVRV
jgi:hypothetical protein